MVHKLTTALQYCEHHLHVTEIPNNLQKNSHILIIIFPLNQSIWGGDVCGVSIIFNIC